MAGRLRCAVRHFVKESGAAGAVAYHLQTRDARLKTIGYLALDCASLKCVDRMLGSLTGKRTLTCFRDLAFSSSVNVSQGPKYFPKKHFI